MFTKFEIGGIAVSVTAMAAALYLLTYDNQTVADLAKESQVAQTGSVFVQGETDDKDALKAALVDATDANGNVQKMIIDDVIWEVINNGHCSYKTK